MSLTFRNFSLSAKSFKRAPSEAQVKTQKIGKRGIVIFITPKIGLHSQFKRFFFLFAASEYARNLNGFGSAELEARKLGFEEDYLDHQRTQK